MKELAKDPGAGAVGNAAHVPDGAILLAVHASPSVRYAPPVPYEAIIDRLLEREGDERAICLLAHDNRAPFDAGLVERLLASRTHPRLHALTFTDLDGLIGLYARCELVISSRMHPLILARVFGKRCIALSDSAKVLDLCARAGIARLDAHDTLETVERCLRNVSNGEGRHGRGDAPTDASLDEATLHSLATDNVLASDFRTTRR